MCTRIGPLRWTGTRQPRPLPTRLRGPRDRRDGPRSLGGRAGLSRLRRRLRALRRGNVRPDRLAGAHRPRRPPPPPLPARLPVRQKGACLRPGSGKEASSPPSSSPGSSTRSTCSAVPWSASAPRLRPRGSTCPRAPWPGRCGRSRGCSPHWTKRSGTATPRPPTSTTASTFDGFTEPLHLNDPVVDYANVDTLEVRAEGVDDFHDCEGRDRSCCRFGPTATTAPLTAAPGPASMLPRRAVVAHCGLTDFSEHARASMRFRSAVGTQ